MAVEFVKVDQGLKPGSSLIMLGEISACIRNPEMKSVAFQPVVTDLFDPLFRQGWIFHNKSPCLQQAYKIGRRGVRLRIRPVVTVNRYKRRRGLVRFRKPESRAAHCRDFYAPDFRLAQVKFFQYLRKNRVRSRLLVVGISHLGLDFMARKSIPQKLRNREVRCKVEDWDGLAGCLR